MRRRRTSLCERVHAADEDSDGDVTQGQLVAEEEGSRVTGEETLELLDALEEGGRAGGVTLDGEGGSLGPDELVEALYFGESM